MRKGLLDIYHYLIFAKDEVSCRKMFPRLASIVQAHKVFCFLFRLQNKDLETLYFSHQNTTAE